MTQELIPGTVYVCPERDIECGDFERNWCKQCPKRRASASPIPASDADPRAAFDAEAPKHRITVERFKNRPDSYKFEHTIAMFRLWMAAWDAARAASTRTASDTRTAAGEAECDAALRAAPASQQPDERFDCPACRGSGEGVMMEGGGPDAYEVPCLCAHCGGSGALDDAYRGACVLLSAEREKYLKLCAEVCAAEFTSSPVPRGGGNTQLVSVESTRPAEVDVEAERKLFEAWAGSQLFDLRRPHATYTNTNTSNAWIGWLAARTQADAGKAGSGAQIAEGE